MLNPMTYLFLEFPVRTKSLSDLIDIVETAGAQITERLNSIDDSDDNRKYLSHVIGIERWAERRLRVALGEPFIEEEYNGHRPSRETSWDDLRTQFAETRAATVATIQQLVSQNVDKSVRVKHNQFGEVSVRGWLRYIFFHGNFESKRIK